MVPSHLGFPFSLGKSGGIIALSQKHKLYGSLIYSLDSEVVTADDTLYITERPIVHFKDAIIMLLPTAISKYLSYCHGHSDSSGKTEPTIFSIPASGEFALSGSDETKSGATPAPAAAVSLVGDASGGSKSNTSSHCRWRILVVREAV
jgi:hypothetical protein